MTRAASPTKLVGILNITPDSFSDGSAQATAEALLRVDALIADGADVIDIGAESTRPGATPLNPEQEWERLSSVVALAAQRCHDHKVAVSIDTRHAETARKALQAGADWINDVSGFSDPAMIEAVKGSACKLVMMHALSVPAKAGEHLPVGADPVALTVAWAIERQHMLHGHGITNDRIIFDPGIGFGKSASQSLALLLRSREMETLGLDLLIGHSRKSFMSLFTQAAAAERDDVTLALSALLVHWEVPYLRVHNVARHRALLDGMHGG